MQHTSEQTAEAGAAAVSPGPSPGPAGQWRGRLRASMVRDYGIVFLVVVLFVVLSLRAPNFLTFNNLTNVLAQNAGLGIVACGATLVILAGGFDLSVGATFALAGVVAAWLAIHVDPVLGLVGGVAAGLLIGSVNGVLIVRLSLNSFLATLASSLMIGGIALAITGGFLLDVSAHAAFDTLGNGELLGVQYTVFVFVALAVAGGLLLRRTTFGRHVYAIGGNAEAARLSGVRVGPVRAATFAVSGFTAGLAGVLAVAESGAAQPNVGTGLALEAIAAVVLGGTSITGGEGAMWRTVLGVALLALIVNGFNILNIQPEYQQVLTGAIIIAAVAVNAKASRA